MASIVARQIGVECRGDQANKRTRAFRHNDRIAVLIQVKRSAARAFLIQVKAATGEGVRMAVFVGCAMKTKLKDFVLHLRDQHRIMTIATNRSDGWPQATIVGYVNDGFLLYCFIARNAQKYANIQRDPRVSIAIGADAAHPLEIKGLSLAGRATTVSDAEEFEHVAALRLKRYPEYTLLPPPVVRDGALRRISAQPPSNDVVLLRIAPEIISVLDYSKGFGHSDLIAFSERDLDLHIESLRHRWDGHFVA
jgi:nitroimidazol reductase NimA-like FMN-containing flavoprotein (pyridoxamine 5'-phosphate oxidase superfamily)